MFTKEDIEKMEDKILAPYAMKSKYSRGKKYPEKEHPYRSIYQRDRDRVIHSAAFRRLEYKTQVFVYHEGDYYRTRLTHTLEAAQIARTISKTIGLNEDLTEAIALAHDLGHTPFGHAVEATIDEIMRDEGGFNHNIQGLKVVDYLEERYPDFKGLNLSWETREGIVKHNPYAVKDYLPDCSEFSLKEHPTLEAQVLDIADGIAYDNHDLDDGIKSGMIGESGLKKIKLWNITSKKVKENYSNINKELHMYLVIRNLINLQVTDLIQTSFKNIKRLRITLLKDVKKCDKRVIGFSSEIYGLREELRNFLLKNLYNNWRVLRMCDKAKRFIKSLFSIYVDNPQMLPPEFRKNIKEKGNIKRSVCDYIAGMTDRYALEEYKKFFDPYEKV